MAKLIFEGLYPVGTPLYNIDDNGCVYEGLYPCGEPIAVIKNGYIYEDYYCSRIIGCVENNKVYGGFYPCGESKFNINNNGNISDGYFNSTPKYCIYDSLTYTLLNEARNNSRIDYNSSENKNIQKHSKTRLERMLSDAR